MKKFLTMLALALSLSINVFSQLNIDSFYQDKENYLIYSTIYNFDSLNQDVLSTRIKNWAGTNFVNMREVLVSETKEQMVFNYITTFDVKIRRYIFSQNWYIRMVVLIKDNKIKVSFYDGGNVFMPGTYSSGINMPSIPSGKIKFLDWSKDGYIVDSHLDALITVKKSIIDKSLSLNKSIKNIETPSNNW